MVEFADKMLAGHAVLAGEKTKEQVAKELGVSLSTVGNWVRAVKKAAVNKFTDKKYVIPTIADPEPQKKPPTIETPAKETKKEEKEDEPWMI